MSRYIDADALIANIPSEEMIAKMAVAHAPTIDAVSVVHGEWIATHKQCGWKCSLCGTEYRMMKKSNYCPNCGAKMDGEREGE